MKNYSIISFLMLLFLASCTEDVDLDVVGGNPKIVIEGMIESGQPAIVSVMRNSPIGSSEDYKEVFQVKDAIVTVSDGTTIDTLYTPKFDLSDADESLTYFWAYKGTSIVGTPGKTYTLKVVADGNTYTAITTIPSPVALDSVWWETPSETTSDTLGFAFAHLTEPVGKGNAYRWYAKREKKYYEPNQVPDRRYLCPSGYTFDDEFIEGKSLEIYFPRGLDPSDQYERDKQENGEGSFFNYYDKTDVIYIKFCTMDYTSFQFYTTYEAAAQSNGNPFASPVTIFSNIEGGGLGVWSGFGVSYDTIYPKP